MRDANAAAAGCSAQGSGCPHRVDDFGTGLQLARATCAIPSRRAEDRPHVRQGPGRVREAAALIHTLVQLGRHSASRRSAKASRTARSSGRLLRQQCELGQGFLLRTAARRQRDGGLPRRQRRQPPGSPAERRAAAGIAPQPALAEGPARTPRADSVVALRRRPHPAPQAPPRSPPSLPCVESRRPASARRTARCARCHRSRACP